jgi:hypothetical protein
MLDAFLRGQSLREAFHDLTPQQINDMSLSEFAARTGMPTPVQAALQAVDHQEPAAAPQSAPQVPEPRPQAIDVNSLSMEQYAALRGQLGVEGSEYGGGIFGAHGSWADAARAKAGRSAMAGNRNTIEAPRIEGRYLDHDAQRDMRSAGARFSTPGNSFQL